MKKLIALLLTVLTMAICLTGCKDKVEPLSNVGGEVKSGNGTFAVEKGDYLYFINGISTDYDNNEMGSVEKGALYRVKTNEIGKKGASVEVVIPKLVSTSSATNGLFIYGDVVYFATPYDQKDKTGTIRSDYTEFRRFDLKSAESESIGYEDNTVNKFQFLQNGSKVYLAYEYVETVDSVEEKKFRVLDASNGNEVYSVDKYSGLFFAEDNSNKIYFAKTAYSNDLEADEAFSEIFCYTAGNSSADLLYSGCGKNALDRDGRNNAEYKSKILNYTDLSGATLTIIKNTGKFLIFKLANTDASATTCYFGLDVANNELKELGFANVYIDTALTSTAVVADLDEIYYIENTTYLKGLVKFDYNKLSESTHGRTLITGKASGYNVAYLEGNYIYLCGSNGDYYRVDRTVENAEFRQINALSAKSLTEWFAPRVIGDKFIAVYSDAMYQSYVYAIDLKDFNDSEKYQEYLDNLETLDREKAILISDTLVGKMTGADKDAFTSSLDANFPEEE